MSHREKSLTPWIKAAKDMTDAEKHEFCRERTGYSAVFLTPNMYAAAERDGWDMRYYVIQKPIPVSHPIYTNGKLVPLMPSTKPRWPCRGEK